MARLVGALAIGAAAVLLSMLWWRADTDGFVPEHCPDGRCILAGKIIGLLTRRDAASLEDLLAYLPGYLHAHAPLVSILSALVALPTGQVVGSFIAVSIAASAVTWLCLRRAAGAVASSLPPTLLLAALAGHLIFLRALARPSSDALGATVTMLALIALAHHRVCRTRGSTAALLAILTAGLHVRLSLVPMLGLPALAELADGEAARSRLRRALAAALLFGLVPAAVWRAGTAAAGTLHTIPATWDAAHLPPFTAFNTARDFAVSFVLAAQAWGVAALAHGPGKPWADPVLRLHLLWVGLYLTFLATGGGALVFRYFLPIVPSVLLLAAPVLGRWYETTPRIVVSLVLGMMGANLLYLHDGLDIRIREPARLLASDARAWLGPAGGSTGLVAVPADVRTTPRAVHLDLGASRPVRLLTVPMSTPRPGGRYAVDGSVDGAVWILLANGDEGWARRGFLEETPALAIPLPGVRVRHLRLIHAGRGTVDWDRADRVTVYASPEPTGGLAK